MALPDFITFNEITAKMNFAETVVKDVGTYVVKVYSQLDDLVATNSSITFKVTVV